MTAPAAPPRPPLYYGFDGDSEGSWSVRGQNFATWVTTPRPGDVLTLHETPDEQAVLVMDSMRVTVSSANDEAVDAAGAALVVVPPGGARISIHDPGIVVVISTTRAAPTPVPLNESVYATPDPAIRPLPELGRSWLSATPRIISMSDVPEVPGRLGRILRTDSLMINWFTPQDGPRDTDALSPHVHDDFEQASLTLEGRFVHHIRQPWTPRLRDWRADEHYVISSPSVTIIPPGNIHTTRAIDAGPHQLIDVFAPPRDDFLSKGWVLNADDYA